jgi:hypothetical protein
MAKRQGVTKTKKVLDYWHAHPKAKAAEIAEALTKAGTPITTAYVYNIKNKGNKRRKAVKAVVKKSGVGIPEIKAALAFLKACGSASTAKEALAAAHEIKAMV